MIEFVKGSNDVISNLGHECSDLKLCHSHDINLSERFLL